MGSCPAAAVCRAVGTTVNCVKRKREGSVLPSLYMLAQVGGIRAYNIIFVGTYTVCISCS